MVSKHFRMGVDIGGTKIAALVLDEHSGVPFRRKITTPNSYEGLLQALKELVDEAESTLQSQVSYGMCYPGSIPPGEAVVHNANLLWLNGKPFEKDLSGVLGRPIKTGNDANCFTLSEALEGAGKGKSVVFGATLGTGLGGGLVVNGHLIEGLNKLGGEWGHNPLPNLTSEEATIEACYCGRVGCQESFLSGTGLSRTFAARYGVELSAEEIEHLADENDSRALSELARYEDRFARACGVVINLIDPDVIVFGGGLSSLKRLYENIPKIWGKYVFSSHPIRTELRPAVFGPESGVRGAALLF